MSAFSLVIFLYFGAYSFEIDNYSCRYDKAVTDSSAAVNAETNTRMKAAVSKVNTYGSGAQTKVCDDKRLKLFLANGIASPWMGNLETWADEAPIPKCKKKKSESVYSKFGMLESPMSGAAGLGPVIKLNGIFVGTDKLSHFMTEGLRYYEAFKKDNSVKSALDVGNRDEHGMYGLRSTGIHSYGDLAANYQGFEFWKQVTEGPNPYFKCKDGVWSQARDFKWEDYVNPAFDEAINCNLYSTDVMKEKVRVATQDLVRTNEPGSPSECPLDHEACKKMSTYFKDPEIYNSVVHEDCRRIANPLAPPNKTMERPEQRGRMRGGRL